MARSQILFLAVTLLLSPALQVYGRVLPSDHPIQQKDVEIPKKLTDQFPKDGEFAKHISDSTESSSGDGKTHVDAKGSASGKAQFSPFLFTAQGQGKINKLTSNGGGHGKAKAEVNTGGFANIAIVSGGGIVHGSTHSEDDGKGSLTGQASGSAKDTFSRSETKGNLKLDGKANGVDDGSSTTRGSGAAGGKAKFIVPSESGVKGNVVAKATDDAKSDGTVHADTKGVNNLGGIDTSTAHGKATGDADSKARHSDAFGSGEAHGGSEAGITHATIQVKGTGESEDKKSDADGEGKASAKSTNDFTAGTDSSRTTASSTVNAKEDSRDGGAKGTAKGIADTGVKDKTAAHSDTKAEVKTGELNGGKGTKVTTKSKHVAAIDLKRGVSGTVSAHGSIKSKSEGGKGDAVAKGGAHSTRSSG